MTFAAWTPERKAAESLAKKKLWSDPKWRARYMASYLAKRGFGPAIDTAQLPEKVRKLAHKLKNNGVKAVDVRKMIEQEMQQ